MFICVGLDDIWYGLMAIGLFLLGAIFNGSERRSTQGSQQPQCSCCARPGCLNWVNSICDAYHLQERESVNGDWN